MTGWAVRHSRATFGHARVLRHARPGCWHQSGNPKLRAPSFHKRRGCAISREWPHVGVNVAVRYDDIGNRLKAFRLHSRLNRRRYRPPNRQTPGPGTIPQRAARSDRGASRSSASIRCGVTGSAVTAPGTPTASSIAEAIAAPAALHPLGHFDTCKATSTRPSSSSHPVPARASSATRPMPHCGKGCARSRRG